jgi:HlyD family secretion protein
MSTQKGKKKWFRAVVIGVILLVLVGVSAKKLGFIKTEEKLEVSMSKVGLSTIVEKVNASGKIQPVNEVKISPDVSGEIKELYVVEGQSVSKGILLARVRPDNYQLAYDRQVALLNAQKAALSQAKARITQTESRLKQVEAQHKRNIKLHADKVISQQDLEVSQANFEQAQADFEVAKQSLQAAQYQLESSEASVRDANETLKLTSIFAPMDGIITKLSVDKGERVVGTATMAGTEMLRIADLERMEVRVDVNENDIIRVSKGDTAIIEVDSYSYLGQKFKGIVTSIANSAKSSGVQQISSDGVTEFEVRVLILKDSYAHLLKENSLSPFRPGMSASVEIITDVKKDVLSVPLSSVTSRKPKSKLQEQEKETSEPKKRINNESLKEYVFVVKADTVSMVEVKTGISDFENIEILSGINEGDQIVVGPFSLVSKKLESGDKVIAKFEEKTKDAKLKAK